MSLTIIPHETIQRKTADKIQEHSHFSIIRIHIPERPFNMIINVYINAYTHIHTCIYIHTYTYIYIYI